MLTSCSNDDNSSSEESLILPKTISYTYPNSPEENYKTIMTYDGNKIVSIDKGDYKTKFIYDGNLIVKQLRFNVDSEGKEIKSRETVYTYSGGKLINKTSRISFSENQPNGSDFVKTDYTHIDDRTISCVQYLPNSTDIDYTATLIYENKNLIKKDLYIIEPIFLIESDVYEYDSKNNPLKNILGFDLLIEEISGYGSNNLVKLKRANNEMAAGTIYKAGYIYDDNNYPIKNSSQSNILSDEYILNLDYTY